MSFQDLYVRAVGEFDVRVQQVKEDQWSDPTPCSEWDVHDLVNHVVNEARWVKPLLSGKTIAEVGDSLDGDLLGSTPHEAWDSARDEELEAVTRLGSLDQEVHVSWGQIPAREYLTQLLMDHLIHSWDLARGIHTDDRLDPELVEFCYTMAKAKENEIRGVGLYGDQLEVPPGADSQTKLLALLGRSG